MVNSTPGGTKVGTFVQRAQWVQMFEQWSNRPQNFWPLFEWNLIITFFDSQSFKDVSDLFLYIFLLQEIHGTVNKTDILVYETIQYTLSLPSFVTHIGIFTCQFYGYHQLIALERTTSVSSLSPTFKGDVALADF